MTATPFVKEDAAGWRPYLPLLAVLALAVALLTIGFAAPGLGEDDDTYRVAGWAARWATEGYHRSRTWGFPLFELYAYPLYSLWGGVVARLPAAGLCLATVILVYRFCLPLRGPWMAALTAAAVLVMPVVHLQATELMETSQSLFLGLGFVLAVLHWRAVTDPPPLRGLLGLSLLAALATATRADNVILVGAYGLAVILSTRRLPGTLVVGGLVFVALVAAIFVGVYGPDQMARIIQGSPDVILPDSWLRRPPRAVLGALAAIGLPFALFIAAGLWRRRFRRLEFLGAGERLFLIMGALLFAVRYVMLPDEVAYLIIPATTLVIILCCALPSSGRGAGWLPVAVLALALPNLVQLALFDRPYARLVVRPSLQPGAIQQDLGYRRIYKAEMDFLLQAERTPESLGCTAIQMRPEPISQPGACLVLNSGTMRYLLDSWADAAQKWRYLAEYDKIWVYDGVNGRGWHQFLSYRDIGDLDATRLTLMTVAELRAKLGQDQSGAAAAAPAGR